MKIIREVEVDDSKSCLDRFVEGVVFLKSLGVKGMSASTLRFYGLNTKDISEEDAKKLAILGFKQWNEYVGFEFYY